MKKILTILIILLLAPSFVLADGMIIPPINPQVPLDENAQIAAINYQDGLEKMIISVNFDMKDYDKAAWVFPVPAEPEKVVIDIISTFPNFYGQDVVQKAKSDIDNLVLVSSLTQIYPLFLFLPFSYRLSATTTGMAEMNKGIGGTVEGVTVYEHIEKGGISTDIVTSRTPEALYSYLQRKGINAPVGSLPVFDYYIGKDYTFIVSYITRGGVLGYEYGYMESYPYRRQPGIFITFPTDRIYYPLIPSSVYGSKTIPVRIYLIGHMTPDLYPDISSYSRTDYYIQNYVSIGDLANFFGNINTNDVKFTKVEINVPSKYFYQDLWFNDVAPRKVNYAMGVYGSISKHPFIFGIIFILIVSTITGAITGLLLFKDFKKFALLGLFNIFTIIGVAIAIAFTRTKKLDETLKRNLKKEGFVAITIDKRKFYFVLLFSVLFLIIAFLVGYIIKLPLM